MSMVIFTDKPPQWFNVDQPHGTVDLYSYIFQLLKEDSLRCHIKNDPVWLVSELLREGARWHDFVSYARRHWDHCVCFDTLFNSIKIYYRIIFDIYIGG